MFNRIQYTALALSAAIVAAGLGATDASAHGFGGFGGRGGFGGGSFGRVSHDPIGGGISRTASSFHVVTRLPPPVPISRHTADEQRARAHSGPSLRHY